jgi:hypothetical protein
MPLAIAVLVTGLSASAMAHSQEASTTEAAALDGWWANTSLAASLSNQMQKFFGSNLAHYLAKEGTIDSQFESVMSSKHDANVDLRDGDALLVSHLQDDPTVRSSLLVGADGEIKAAGLVHHGCMPSSDSTYACDTGVRPTLTIFIPKYSAEDKVTNMFVIARVREWAIRSVRRSPSQDSKATDLKVQVRELNAGGGS